MEREAERIESREHKFGQTKLKPNSFTRNRLMNKTYTMPHEEEAYKRKKFFQAPIEVTKEEVSSSADDNDS
jgi:hypothetical protein